MSAISGPWVAETSVAEDGPENRGLAVIAVLPEVQRNGHGTPTRGMVAWVQSGAGACARDEQAIATARLIAAAPDLLSLVKRFVALPSGSWHPEKHAADEAELMRAANLILARTEGRTS